MTTVFRKRCSLLFGVIFLWGSLVPVASHGEVQNGGTEMNSQKVLQTIAISFIIGNVVSWALGAHPRTFPKQAFTPDEQEIISEIHHEINLNPSIPGPRTELGALYFKVNELEKADEMLLQDYELDQDNMETLAWLSANRAKQAGAMWDFTMGIRKLYRLNIAIDGLNQALVADPENATVRLVHLATTSSLKGQSSDFDSVFEDERWFMNHLRRDPDYFPHEIKMVFYSAMAETYLVKAEKDQTEESRHDSLSKASHYLSSFEAGSPLTETERNQANDLHSKIETVSKAF